MTAETSVAEGGHRREHALALSVTVFATIAFGLVALGDSASPLPAGHCASTASVGIIADNILGWHVPWPVWSYTSGPPTADQAYGHHPWGIFWTTAAIFSVLGRSDFTCRLAPILLSTATVPLLHALGTRLHRPFAGAAAAALFAALPITLAFASFNALEVPVIAWSVLSLWGFVGLFGETPRRRDAIAFAVGALFAAECDWPGFLTAGFLLAGGLAALALRPPSRAGRAGKLRWIAILATASALVLALAIQIAWLRAIGKWDELLYSYDVRSAGHGAPIWRVIAQRRWWLELSFTKLGLALATTGLPLLVWRARARRRLLELAPLALGATAAIQYVVFRQGADVHVFWPQHFTPFIALTFAAWVATGCEAMRERKKLAWAVPAAALAATLWIARDGLAALRYARATGGRFDERGLLIHSDGDTIAAIRSLVRDLPEDGIVELDTSLKPTWSQSWSLARPSVVRAGMPEIACISARRGAAPAAWLADTRFVPASMLREIATQCAARTIGPLLVVEPGPQRPLDAWRLDEHVGSGLDGYLRATSEPLREAAPDPFGAWELRLHLDQPTGELPPDPKTFDELRIARNAAKLAAHGDQKEQTQEGGDEAGRHHVRSIDAMFEDGTRIVGALDATMPGQATILLVEAAGPLPRGVELSVIGRVVEPMPLSLTMADPHRREMAMPPRIPPSLWRAGWVYPIEIFIHPRPGVEELRASLVGRSSGRAPRLVSGERDVVIGRSPLR